MNETKFPKPYFDKVLVEVVIEEVETKTESGLIKTVDTKKNWNKLLLAKVIDKADDLNGDYVGKNVYISPGTGMMITVEGKDYVIIKDEDIQAICD
jgi:co-chaperonin GroES (HSP10)